MSICVILISSCYPFCQLVILYHDVIIHGCWPETPHCLSGRPFCCKFWGLILNSRSSQRWYAQPLHSLWSACSSCSLDLSSTTSDTSGRTAPSWLLSLEYSSSFQVPRVWYFYLLFLFWSIPEWLYFLFSMCLRTGSGGGFGAVYLQYKWWNAEQD